jgi:succinate dehydrogenase / fumarate reductase cytochrome b subunit
MIASCQIIAPSIKNSFMASETFIWRRVHSLMGLWLIIYLFEHLLVNSQATLWLGDDGIGFVRLVNLLESLPYLQVLEILLIGIPLLVHGYWGVKRIFTSKINYTKNKGNAPSLGFERNRAFSWQRWTSWVLLFGILFHVIQMRFVEMPHKVRIDNQERFVVRLNQDPGLHSLAERIQVTLLPKDERYFSLKENQVVAIAQTPGKAMLLMVRETFKSPLMSLFYTVFVLAAAFHAFNGFWTSLITWGILLSYRSQRTMIVFSWIGCGLLAFLGLAAIWGSYLVNLRN